MVTTVLLLRHAEPVMPGTPGFDEFTRPLTERGARDAAALAVELGARPIDAVYSSPYRRAIATVEPLAAARGLAVQLVHDLREHLLSPEPVVHWRELIAEAWRDFDAAPGGGDTLRATRERGLSALEELRARHASQTIAIGGHGTLFSCLLHSMLPGVHCEFALAMPMPALYELVHDGCGWRAVSGPGVSSQRSGPAEE